MLVFQIMQAKIYAHYLLLRLLFAVSAGMSSANKSFPDDNVLPHAGFPTFFLSLHPRQGSMQEHSGLSSNTFQEYWFY